MEKRVCEGSLRCVNVAVLGRFCGFRAFSRFLWLHNFAILHTFEPVLTCLNANLPVFDTS